MQITADCDARIRRALEQHKAGLIPKGSMFHRLVLFWHWLKSDACKIRDIRGEIVALRPNLTQRLLFSKMLDQAEAGLPIRGVVLKARKPGVSTFIQALTFFLCAHYPNQVALMLAHDSESTIEIFEIGHRIANEYPLIPTDPTVHAIRFPRTSGRYRCRTAGGEGIGAGGTPSLLHLSEVALWHTHKEDTEATATSAIPPVPESVIVWESTARGRDLFYRRFEAASKGETPAFSLFIPWFLGELWRLPAPAGFQRDTEEDGLARLALTYGITMHDDQLYWRRCEIAHLGPALFRQEFPSTPQEAVQARRGLVLPLLASRVVSDLPFNQHALAPEAFQAGVDCGYHDATAIVKAFYVDQCLYITHVYRRVSGLARDHVKAVLPTYTYWCDPSALEAREELARAARDAGMDVAFKTAPRTKVARQQDFLSAEYTRLHRLCAEERLFILEPCADRLLLEAEHLLWDESTGQPNMKRGEPWGHFDCLDAVRYLCMGVFGAQPLREDFIIKLPEQESRREGLRAM